MAYTINSDTIKFRDLPRNTRITILTQPLWSVPAGLVMSFATLYAMNIGLSSQQVGLISSISSAVKMLVALFAGWVLDRIGRKLSTVVFDFVSWVIPYYFWATADSFNSFLLAGIFNGLVIICTLAHDCYHVEDVPIEKRMVSLRYKSIVDYIYGFMPLAMGLLINKYSLVPAVRGGYWFGFICSLLFVIIKVIFLRDTRIGREKRKYYQASAFSTKDVIIQNIQAIGYMVRRKELLMLCLIHLIVMFGKSISTLYFMPFLSQAMKMPDAQLGWVPIATTLVSILVTYFVIPSTRGKYRSLLVYALIALTIGSVAMTFATPATLAPLVIINIVMWGFSNACSMIVLQAQIHLLIEDGIRSRIMSALQVFSMLVMLPSGILGGFVYAFLPAALIGFISLLFFVAAAIYCLLISKGWFKGAELL